MADNTSADFTKILLIDLEINSEKTKQEIPILTKAIDQLTTSQKQLENAGQKSSKQYVEQAAQLRQLKAEVRDANKYVDNVTKAINAETASIAQNRALLSLITADVVKMGQEEGRTAEATQKAAVVVNNLTDKLKEQEKTIGQTYRNVGNYTDSINKSNIANGKAATSLQTFSSGIDKVRQGMGFLPQSFTAMAGPAGSAFSLLQSSVTGFSTVIKNLTTLEKDAAVAAEVLAEAENVLTIATLREAEAQAAASKGLATAKEVETASTAVTEAKTAVTEAQTEATVANTAATEAGSIGLTGWIAAALGVVALAGLVISWFAKLTPNAENLKRQISGLGSAYDAFMSDLGRGVGFGTLFDDMSEAYTKAKELTGAMQDLARETEILAVENANADGQIADLQLKMRNRRNTPEQEKSYFDQIQKISNDSYLSRKDIADKQYKIAVESAVNGRKFTEEEIANVKKLGVVYAAELDKNKGLANKSGAGSDVAAIAKAQEMQAEAERYRNTIQDRALNRLNSNEDKAKSKAAAAEQKAEELRQKQLAAYEEAENLRKSSAARELQSIYEEYGDKAIAIDQNYNNELTKLKKFLAKKLITQQEYNSVEKQLTSEKNASIQKLISDFQDQDYQTYLHADQELRSLQIENIADDRDRAIAGLKEKEQAENIAIQESNRQHLKNIDALNIEIGKLSGVELNEAKERLRLENLLIQENDAKQVEQAKQTAAQIALVNKNAADKIAKLRDANNVQEATKKFGDGSSEALAAKKQALQDDYNAEVTQAGLSAETKLEIERKFLADSKKLNDDYRNNKYEFAYKAEQMVQSAGFEILTNALQARSQAILNQLETSKAAELQNTNLVGGQKRAIEAKYTKLENQEKLKAFKANQKLQAANTFINGAVAVIKNIAEMGFLPSIPINALTVAETGLSIAKILSQKPAFATGGVFESDGKGAVLPGYSRVDNTNARLRSGEGVVVSEAMRNPQARSVISDINVAFGGRSFIGASKGLRAFAAGGIFTDGGSANRYYSQPVVEGAGLANSLAYQLINNFPDVIVDVKDINAQQSIKAKTENRVTF